MRALPRALLAVAALLCGSAAHAARPPLVLQERDYDCKILASTQELPLNIGAPPQMNAWGQVAFRLYDQSGLGQIRVGHGDKDGHGRPITWIVADEVSATGAIAFLGEPVIEDGGLVVFSAYQQSGPGATAGGQGILRVPYFQRVDRSPAPIVTNTFWDPPGAYLGDIGNVSTNSVSSLLFQLADHPNAMLYVGSNVVAQDGANGISELIDNAELINPGSTNSFYAFRAQLTNGEIGVFLNGSLRDSVSRLAFLDLEGLSVHGDAVPVAAYVRSYSNGGTGTWTIESESDAGHQTLVDSTIDPFDGVDIPLATSLNVWNEVAFVANSSVGTNPDASRLFVVHDASLWRVHCQDMQGTFGSPVLINHQVSPRAINDDGQIAFLAQDGVDTFLIRADPLPGQTARPTSCSGLDDGAPCDDGNPVTISSCQAQVCTGKPSGYPASCADQPDYTPCQAGDPKTLGFCVKQACVGMSPVPEPSVGALAIAMLAALCALGAPWSSSSRSPSRIRVS